MLLFDALSSTKCHSTDLTHTIAHCPMLFPTVGWPTTSALAANLTYLYTLPLYLLLLFIPQHSSLVYLYSSTVTVYGISNCALSQFLFFPVYCLHFPVQSRPGVTDN